MRSNKIINIMQRVKLRDFFAILLFVFLFPISMIYKIYLKIKKKPMWLICESKDTAGDNGYHLFKYIKEKHPEINCYYAIDKKCKDYEKIKQYDNVIVPCLLSGSNNKIGPLAVNKPVIAKTN